MGIFSNIRILDFTQVIAGSYGTTIMGDLGAEVIKVEPPVIGDTLRLAGPMYKGESGFFLLNNRNKKSVSINLKTKEGLEIVKKLIVHCDIIAQNFKPGVMDALGLGYNDAKKIKEDIIYVCVSGYGFENDCSDRPAYDNIIQAESGLAAQNGYPEDGRPLRNPLSISDYTAGIYSAFAMASALYHRMITGEGQFIDIAMFDSLISIMDNSFLIYSILGNPPQPLSQDELLKLGLKSTGNRHPGAAPHGFYRTKDGFIAHMSLTNKMWHTLLRIIGREELIGDPKYEKLDNRKALWREIDTMIEAWSSKKTTDEALKILTDNDLPCGKVRTIDEVFNDMHSQKRNIFNAIEHKIAGKMTITNVPIKYSKTPTEIKAPSPLLGEHNEEILCGLLKLDQKKIDELMEKKVLYKERK